MSAASKEPPTRQQLDFFEAEVRRLEATIVDQKLSYEKRIEALQNDRVELIPPENMVPKSDFEEVCAERDSL